ncbi:hypothetical protein F8M41_025303 [Gigaspora margarita]|uniref:Uncharacterized protein n=1 Tax=Gigaspora margarita TaxID=4874 RepID=A0A8H4ABN6_GIGMA|nr:hypothetical protein F8M41_025303 [Gigaspora margarita]
MLGKSDDFVDLKVLNCNKTDMIRSDFINDDVIDDDIINDHINNDITNNNINKLSSNGLDPSTSSDPLIVGSQTNQCNANNIHNSLNSNTNAIDISNHTVGNDEERIDIMLDNVS